MGELQTLLALVVLIYVLCVIVQAVQEIIKSALQTKAKTMASIVTKFMGDHLDLGQVKSALQQRGLDITALEKFNKDDFRKLLDGIQFTPPQLAQIPNVVATAGAGVDQLKEQIAASYDAAMASFQQLYAKNNKVWVLAISFAVVLGLNANLIKIYETLSVDQKMSQAISGTATAVANMHPPIQNAGAAQGQTLEAVYSENRKAIQADLKDYPVLLRTFRYGADYDGPLELVGLLVMGFLVSLGAPFWNDVLKGANGINNALNSGGKSARQEAPVTQKAFV
jgi:hypothetical protein